MVAYTSTFAHGLMFHRFHKAANRPPGQGSLTEGQFEQVLNYIGTDRILLPEEWLYRVKKNSLQKHHLCITFDDGLKCQFDIALSILERYKLKAFWFVFSSVFDGGIGRFEVYNRFAATEFTSFNEFFEEFLQSCPVPDEMFKDNAYEHFVRDFKEQFPFYSNNEIKFRYIRNKLLPKSNFEEVMDSMIEARMPISKISNDLWLTNEHLKLLSKNGHCIGLHSYDHPLAMADLTPAEQEEQYARNYKHISHVTGKRVECMSHPCNSYNADTIDILSKMNICCGFRSNMTPPIGKPINAHCLEFAREDGVNLLKYCKEVL
jgi:peptidoglycan/xylan/chitin deacetylase (PgdA/CDA1 family)